MLVVLCVFICLFINDVLECSHNGRAESSKVAYRILILHGVRHTSSIDFQCGVYHLGEIGVSPQMAQAKDLKVVCMKS